MSGEITRHLERLREGDAAALDEIVPLLYGELRAIARQWLRKERQEHTFGTTALVHEAYLKLLGQQRLRVEDRGQFFAVASNTMRRLLVDYARTRKRLKRGGEEQPIPLEEVEAFLTDVEAEEVLALEEALKELEVTHPRGRQVVEHRFFGGLSVEETAEALRVSRKTVQRDWIAVRAWLRFHIHKDPADRILG